jgi:hypothetical protein
VEGKMLPYCDVVMEVLMSLESSQLQRDVKPLILSVIGDIAIAIGPLFQRYLAPPSRVVVMLHLASQIQVEMNGENDEHMVEYMNSLHLGGDGWGMVELTNLWKYMIAFHLLTMSHYPCHRGRRDRGVHWHH